MAEKRITYIPPKTAIPFHKNHDDEIRLLKGPVGSGKSVACCFEVYRRIIKQRPFEGVRKSRWAIIRATIPELKTTTIKTWMAWFGHQTVMKFGSPITGHMQFPLSDGTYVDAELIFMPQQHEADLEKLKSLELTGAWINEASEVSKEAMEVVHSRTKRFPAKKDGGANWFGVIMDTNSFDSDHWMYDLFYQDIPPNHALYDQPPALIRSVEDGVISYNPNPLAENIENHNAGFDYYLGMIHGKSQAWVDVFILNKIASHKEGDYVYADYDPSYSGNHTKKAFDPNKAKLYWTHDQNYMPMSSAIIQRENDIDFVIDEIILSAAGPEAVASEFVDRYKGYAGLVVLHGDRYGRQGEKHGLNSYYSIIMSILQENGIRVELKALKQNPPIKDSQDSLRSRICDAYGCRRLMVNPETAPITDKGLAKVTLKEGSSFLEVETRYQHVTTALRYFTYKRYSKEKKGLKVTSLAR